MRCLFLLSILFSGDLAAISIVYNFRIAQITREPIVENRHENELRYRLIALFFDQYQKKYTGNIDQNFGGGLCSFIYDFWDNYYFRTDAAVSHIQQTTCNLTTFASTKTDDILFTVGRDFRPHDRTKLTLSGLFGIPTHPIFTLQHVDFGYGQIGTGVQADGSYEFDRHATLLCGTRYVHFVPRSAEDSSSNRYKFNVGNIGDILVGVRKRWGGHGLESGYSARWNFGARIVPSYDDIVAKTNAMRNSFYLVYKYHFQIAKVSNRLLFNISYGFDSSPQRYGNKHIITGWASWNIHF